MEVVTVYPFGAGVHGEAQVALGPIYLWAGLSTRSCHACCIASVAPLPGVRFKPSLDAVVGIMLLIWLYR